MDLSLKILEEAVAVRKQIDQLRSRLHSLLGGASAPSSSGPATSPSAPRAPRKRRGGLSAAGRERIAAAARARWARAKAAAWSRPQAARSLAARRKKAGSVRPAVAKLSQMMKARWAARRRAQG